MTTVLITGGTGLIGKALTKALLHKDHRVIILTRDTRKASGYALRATSNAAKLSFAEWNIEKQTIDVDAISRADYIIHLAGANLGDKRWTRKRKQEIVSSRVDSGKLIVKSLLKISNRVRAVISASAIGWYGPDLPPTLSKGGSFEETDPAFTDFLGKTCEQWEKSIEPVTGLGKRLVVLRSGIVLSKEGGAFPKFLKPLKFGLATILGNGKQIISWIHIDDLVRLYITAIENKNLAGVYNAIAPHPVSNKEFVLTLAKTRGKFFIPFRVPSFVLKIVLGEMSIEVLKSATVSSEKIQQTGFQFLFPTINSAIQRIISS